MTWEVLCKCSGKYIDIYFNLEITYFASDLALRYVISNYLRNEYMDSDFLG